MDNEEHHQTSKDERKGFLKGTAVGVALGSLVGAIGGILFAPQSGKETRAQLARMLKKSANNLEQQMDKVKNKVHDFSDAVGKDLEKLMEKAAGLRDEIVNFTRLTGRQGAEITEDTRKEAKRLMDESAKVAADLKRILAKKLDEAQDLAASTSRDVKNAVDRDTGKANGPSRPKK